jgi:hypothetical protein
MAHANTAMPATARHGEPASEIELLGGLLDNHNSDVARPVQVSRLMRRFGFSRPRAIATALLCYGEAPNAH